MLPNNIPSTETVFDFPNNCKLNEDNKKSRLGKGNNDVFFVFRHVNILICTHRCHKCSYCSWSEFDSGRPGTHRHHMVHIQFDCADRCRFPVDKAGILPLCSHSNLYRKLKGKQIIVTAMSVTIASLYIY